MAKSRSAYVAQVVVCGAEAVGMARRRNGKVTVTSACRPPVAKRSMTERAVWRYHWRYPVMNRNWWFRQEMFTPSGRRQGGRWCNVGHGGGVRVCATCVTQRANVTQQRNNNNNNNVSAEEQQQQM